MKISSTKIPDVKLIEPEVFGDERGYFMETWQKEKYREFGISYDFVQDNHSRSVLGTLRGLHYQNPNPQGKIARVVLGEVFDVAVDLRKNSETFGHWIGVILSAQNKHMLWVPPGFAHGFYVLSDVAEFIYKCTDYYSPEDEHTLLWNDKTVGINWPITDKDIALLSEKDKNGLIFEKCTYFE